MTPTLPTETEASRATKDLPGKIRKLGPAWIAGAIAAGPATMASVLGAGAAVGFGFLWVVVLSSLLAAFSVYLAMRLGLFTGEGIVATVEKHLGKSWAWVLVVDTVLAAGLAQLVIMRTVAQVSHAIAPQLSAQVWGVLLAVLLAGGLVVGGYKALEIGAKLLVSLVVLAFIASLVVIPWNLGEIVGVLRPFVPTTAASALLAAGVMGGAVHISLITMTTYTMRARGWTRRNYGFAKFDIFTSFVLMFGLYSVAIFLVAAAVLHGNPDAPVPLTHLTASIALGPIAGGLAQALFLAGLWGAAISTLGANAFVPPYVIAHKLRWDTTVTDPRFRTLVAAFVLGSAAGAFLDLENFLTMLVYVLAFGLVGTVFAIAIVLYLLNTRAAVPERTGPWINAGGLALVGIVAVLGANYVRTQVAAHGLRDPTTLLVTLFALAILGATVALAARYLIHRPDRPAARPTPAPDDTSRHP